MPHFVAYLLGSEVQPKEIQRPRYAQALQLGFHGPDAHIMRDQHRSKFRV